MNKCAESGRFDCANLLIRYLAATDEPYPMHIINRRLSDEEKLPAIYRLRQFGDDICPLLYYEALATDKQWYRIRLIFAIKNICSVNKIDEMKKMISMRDSKNELLNLLDSDTIDVSSTFLSKPQNLLPQRGD